MPRVDLKCEPRDLTAFSVDDVVDYIDACTELGEYRANYARGIKVAIRRVGSALPSGANLDYMRRNLDAVVNKWVRITRAKPTTKMVYLSRCRRALSDFSEMGADAWSQGEAV